MTPDAAAEETFEFIERWALSDDRGALLKELIPGTREHFYYSALLAQQEERFEEVEQILQQWAKQYGNEARMVEIRHRQALLNYPNDPKASLDYLVRELGLTFNHEKQTIDQKPDFPTKLDPELISWEVFAQRALRSDRVSQVTQQGLRQVLARRDDLSQAQVREIFKRLKYADIEGLVPLIAEEFGWKGSAGFGQFQVHHALTLAQLDELSALRPDLNVSAIFVNARLARLQPSEDIDMAASVEERRAYLNRVWEYVESLEPSFNSLKASVLYRRLVEARAEGRYPEEEFLQYLQLPRQGAYISQDFLKKSRASGGMQMADLNANFEVLVGVPPVRNDQELVRDYLEHLMADVGAMEKFLPYIKESYLRQVFAENQLLRGADDAADYLGWLSPDRVKAIRERVEITFSPENSESFSAADAVALKVDLKHVEDLIVKVYEINTKSFYLDRLEEINTDLNLDGLVANREQTIHYDEPSVIRHEETIALEELKGKRGTWVVELIGNGMSSRALIRKGNLQFLSRTTKLGEAVQLLTEDNERAKEATVWFGGKEYPANDKGVVLLPFSNQGASKAILSDGQISTLVELDLPAEQYQFRAGFFIEQESLLTGAEAKVLVRPQLLLQGEPVSVAQLEQPLLQIRTVDADGIVSNVEVKDFELFDDRESVHEFRVPPRLREVSVSLEGTIDQISETGPPLQLSAERTFEVNGIESGRQVADIYLSRFDSGYQLEVRGRSGEPMADRAVAVSIRHRDFKEEETISLKSDPEGKVHLGKLPEIVSIGASSEGMRGRHWQLETGQYCYSRVIHAVAGEVVTIPLESPIEKLTPDDFALFEIRSGQIVSDQFDRASLQDGAVRIEGLARGDYRVVLRNAQETIDLRVTEAGAEVGGFALSDYRHLSLASDEPLYIEQVEAKGGKLRIDVKNADDFTRVQVVATRFVPSFDLYRSLQQRMHPPAFEISRDLNRSFYLSGRDIGEEYRYILERRSLPRFPGNQLKRPSLLLNPWELNETETDVQEAAKGEAYEKSDLKGKRKSKNPIGPPAAWEGRDDSLGVDESKFSFSYQFLNQQAKVLTNLAVGEDGAVVVDLNKLEGLPYVKVVAMNADATASHLHVLAESDASFRDLTLKSPLDSEKAFTQRKNVSVLGDGESLMIDDIRSSEIAVYDTVGDVYSVMQAISQDSNLTKFGFITRWHEGDEAQKREWYSEHACHELHLFLAEKDRAFFEAEVQPYLRNKKDKTFMDHFLLGDDLSDYTKPWAFERLNVVEKILLGRRLGGDAEGEVAKHVVNQFDLLPIDVDIESYFYEQALRGLSGSPGEVGAMYSMAVEEDEAKDYDAFAEADPFAGPVEAGAAAASVRNAGMLESKKRVSMLGLSVLEEESVDPFSSPIPQRLYRQIDGTKEWAENNYYELPIAQQVADLVTVNRFWKDFAEWDGKGGFFSREFASATGNFTEMMLALSVLDLPFEAVDQEVESEEYSLKIGAKSPVIVFHEEIQETERAEGETPVLVSQNFFRADDRYRYEGQQRMDKFVRGEFLTGVVYGSQIVLTNPTSTTHRLDLLVQIPEGAIPVGGSDYTKSFPFGLGAFTTEKLEVLFYFPKASGKKPFAGYPVQVAKNEMVIASGEVSEFLAVDQLSNPDETSWDFLSQQASDEEVLAYLKGANLERLDLNRIAWRVRESEAFFKELMALLSARFSYQNVLWSYGFFHRDVSTMREYLKHRGNFLGMSGSWMESELVDIDPVARHWYQHLEYSPLVNARVNQLGRERSILNDRFRSQYDALLRVLRYKPELSTADEMAISAYLLLQDRIEEGLAWYDRIDSEQTDSKLQYDYLSAYVAFYREEAEQAAAIAEKYADHPVTRWRERFAEVASQAREIAGEQVDREEDSHEQLAEVDPFLEVDLVGREVALKFRNLEAVKVNYYEMDLEFLFSSKPFVSAGSGQFAYIKPNSSQALALPEDGSDFSFTVPEAYASKNVLVEVVGAGQRETVAVYSNQLNVELSERYGQLAVSKAEDGKVLPKVYVKVYAKMKGGAVRFYKDGYTDLRGKFDYVSLSTDELDLVEKFSLLIMSDEDGSVVKEVSPPQR